MARTATCEVSVLAVVQSRNAELPEMGWQLRWLLRSAAAPCVQVRHTSAGKAEL